MFLPTQTWFSNGIQRPQQLSRALSEDGHTVVFCEPWYSAAVWMTSETERERRFRGLRQIAPNLWLLRCPPEVLREVIERGEPDAIIMNWPDQAHLLPPRGDSLVVYEMIEDHSVMPQAGAAWLKTHEHWVRNAGVLAASADAVAAQLRPVRPDVLLVPNGVRLEDWDEAVNLTRPDDLVQARRASLVVGYNGVLAEWFDWRMWLGAARARPEWAFVLIGYPADGDAERVQAMIDAYPNVYYLGPKPSHTLARYLRHVDVATIPFVLNEFTHGCSPMNLFEYMAAGKPIVCSPMREVQKYRSVRFATTSGEFLDRIEEARRLRDDEAYLGLLRQEASENTWAARGRILSEAVRTAIARRGRVS